MIRFLVDHGEPPILPHPLVNLVFILLLIHLGFLFIECQVGGLGLKLMGLIAILGCFSHGLKLHALFLNPVFHLESIVCLVLFVVKLGLSLFLSLLHGYEIVVPPLLWIAS